MAEAASFSSTDDYFKWYKEKNNKGKDWVEIGKDQMVETDYPEPIKRYRIIYETYQNSIEEGYFWLLNYLRYDLGFAQIDKLTDIFAAAETSVFGGVVQQRVGLQQDKVSQFLATIGKMVKELFQLVRELRILDERLGYYEGIRNPDPKQSEPAEITLKGIYIDMAEGGTKNPSSVFGLARELQFTTLPDLFFSVHPKKREEVGPMVDKLDFNENVKRVLKRKLYTYIQWKVSTEVELKQRKTFTLKYLKQHFDIVNMYMHWVKPYLKTIKRLQTAERKLETPDLIASFEGSMIEIEILARWTPPHNKDYESCLLINFDYRTRPSMNYQGEYYQRGPLHVGELKITYRTYAWDKEDIENYKLMRNLEDLELLTAIDESVKEAMNSLGEELKKYYEAARNQEAAEEKVESVEVPSLKPKSLLEPFFAVTKAFRSVLPKGGGRSARQDKMRRDDERARAEKATKGRVWNAYKNFKKSHKMLHW